MNQSHAWSAKLSKQMLTSLVSGVYVISWWGHSILFKWSIMQGSGLRDVSVWGFLNKAKLVSLGAATCPRSIGLVCSLLSSPTWTQSVAAQHPVYFTPEATADPRSLPMVGAALHCFPLCHRWVSPLGPQLAHIYSALVYTKQAKMHSIES